MQRIQSTSAVLCVADRQTDRQMTRRRATEESHCIGLSVADAVWRQGHVTCVGGA